MIMNKEELIDECVRYIADDVWKKDVLTYKEQDEYKEYLNTIIETITKEKDKKIEKLNKQVQIMEKYFELIIDLGYDYDGFNNVEDLKGLIDTLCKYASLGRACNTTESIYVNRDKHYNILNEELKEGK